MNLLACAVSGTRIVRFANMVCFGSNSRGACIMSHPPTSPDGLNSSSTGSFQMFVSSSCLVKFIPGFSL